MYEQPAHDVNDHPSKVIKVKSIETDNPREQKSIKPMTVEDETIKMKNELQRAEESLKDLKKQKDKMIQDTIEVIKQQKNDWEKEKEILEEQTRQSGFEAGFSLGKQESINQYKELINQANNIVRSATTDYYSTLDHSDNKIITLAIHTAEKIIQEKLSDDPNIFMNIINTAINELKDHSRIAIYLHPDHYQFVSEQKSELVTFLDPDTKLSIFVDQERPKGTCLIHHPLGQIDASIDTQLEQIHKALNEVMQEIKQ